MNHASSEDWIARLQALRDEQTSRPVVFLVGSALTLPDSNGGRGVWGVERIIQYVAERFPDCESSQKGSSGYQDCLEKVRKRKGPPEVDGVIRRAVLTAANLPEVERDSLAPDEEGCRALQRKCWEWDLRASVEAFADYVHSSAGADRPPVQILTTNFDGLIEIALRRRGAAARMVEIVNDRDPTNEFEPGEVPVWHIHGLWCGVTMHQPMELSQARPLLFQYLLKILEGSTVVVLGYGGWRDLLLQSVSQWMDAASKTPEVMWALYWSDPNEIQSKAAHVFDELKSPMANNRATFYTGVDVHDLLPKLQSPEDQVRRIAIEAFRRLLTDHPELVPLLQRIVNKDPDELILWLMDADPSKSLASILAELQRVPPADSCLMGVRGMLPLLGFLAVPMETLAQLAEGFGDEPRSRILRVAECPEEFMALILSEVLQRSVTSQLTAGPKKQVPGVEGAWTPDQMMEVGPDPEARRIQFESLLWNELELGKGSAGSVAYDPSHHRGKLLGHLASLANQRRQFVILTSEVDPANEEFKSLNVMWVELKEEGPIVFGVDAYEFGSTLNEILRLLEDRGIIREAKTRKRSTGSD
jgi:hypothetical protein